MKCYLKCTAHDNFEYFPVSTFIGLDKHFFQRKIVNIFLPIKAISHIHQSRTETEPKILCLSTYECFHMYAAATKTENETENVHELDFILLVLVAEFQQIRQVILIKSAWVV